MPRRISVFAAFSALLLLLAGCSDFGRARRPAWRTEAEDACLAQHLIQPSAYVEPEPEIDGPGICGLTRPFKVTALLNGEVTFNGHYTLDCPMIAALNNWVRDVVEPAAEARFGERVVELTSLGSYSCRGINGMAGARLSEHAFGNAIDISGFRLADGHLITVVHDWFHGDPTSAAFLRDVDAGACSYFTTVLGPGFNIFHYNHFHVDLAMRGNTSTGPRSICKPDPATTPLPVHAPDGLPEPPPLDEDLDISQAGAANAQALALHGPGGHIDAAVPPPAPITRTTVATADPSSLPVPGSDFHPYQPAEPEGDYSPAQRHYPASQSSNAAPEGRPSDWDLAPVPQQ